MIKEIHVTFRVLSIELQRKFPASYGEFLQIAGSEISLKTFVDFFKTNHILISYAKTRTLKPAYAGTFNFKVRIKSISALRQLGRTKMDFTYYGLMSNERAAMKAITKSFEILESLKTGKQMPQTTRKR